MLDLLATEPAAAISMREVARRAGVSHAAPRHHFASREALVDAVAVRGMEKFIEVLEAAAAIDEPPPIKLRELGRAYMSFALENNNLFNIVSRRDHVVDPAVVETVARLRDDALDVLHNLVVTNQELGLLPAGDSRAITNALWGQVHGLSLLVANGLMDVEEAIEAESALLVFDEDGEARPWAAPADEHPSSK